MTTTTNTRTHSWTPPSQLPADFAELSGLEFLQAMLDGKVPPPPIAGTLDFTLLSVEPGVAVFEGQTGEHQYNPLGSIHGGYLATLLDSALGCSVMTALPPGQAYTTIQLNVNMIRPAFAHTGPLRCEARTLHVGRTVATAEAKVVGSADGKLYAHGTTTCAIFPLR
ncbi:aromatic compound catabolic protein [Acrocarpospora corrugata]|uniref:Aromatic compound catabolic protein n=1 Tax=Acrocarpospora corrugata TaxID=35763 RepID=A0A5M3VXX9_9ACTN|nr:PaaI family thioesterase [Acrocarpospora corrugata]GER99932.1 aromatic compound catabolic protein [Acrocarpospora corrugata]